MPEIVGRLRTPRLASAPSSPAVGEVYYDTATNILYWWNGTAWISAGGGGAGADLVYNGSFPANTPYTDGDIVVSNGIAYLCVRPTSAAPTAWPQASAGSDLVYNGAFPTNTPYTDGDIVIQNGITYLCVRPTSAAPTPWPRANVITSYGTSLPTSPGDGQEAILVDSITNPTYQWHFRYNASSTSAYKWEFIGGAPRLIVVWAAVTISAATWSNIGPSFTIPRAGQYAIDSAVSEFQPPGGTVGIYQGPAISTAGASGPPMRSVRSFPGPTNNPDNMGIARDFQTLASGDSMTVWLYCGIALSGVNVARSLQVIPQRVS
jgi:hypothetical protein